MVESQTYDTHVRRFPAHVNALYLVLLALLVWTGYRLVTAFSADHLFAFLGALALPWIGVVSRTQTLTVQNRVIRLEERLRYRGILAADVAERAAHLPIAQIIALRFAPDEELPELVADVLSGKLSAPKDIKQRVRDWRADHLRA
jgi:hypothetical protein